ncbi:MAG: thiamine-phosphate kinase [Phycisphaerae bacterium]|nr:thiamine-phosphate kinase [Phycisphaerae bacterium]
MRKIHLKETGHWLMAHNLSEFKLIHWIRQQSTQSHPDLQTGIGDDMAIMQMGGQQLLITTDMLLEGVHFDFETATLEQVGYKSMAVSLSDCAGMAAVPFIAVVGVALPKEMTMEQAKQLYQGLQKAAEQFNCPIVGGDTTRWDKPLAIDVTMLARQGKHPPVHRSGALVGDIIMTTGTLGGSLAGKHLDFTPRVKEALALTDLVTINAMMDVSDGISSDLRHICRESGVGAVIEAKSIPISAAVERSVNPLAAAMNDGEDFELLFTLCPENASILEQKWPALSDLKLSPIGRIIAADKDASDEGYRVFLKTSDKTITPLEPKGWEH